MTGRGSAPSTPRETTAEKPSRNGQSADAKPDGKPEAGQPDVVAQAADAMGSFESAASKAAESLVAGRGFATVLGMLTENVMAMTRIGNDMADLVLRNLRLAGRQDIARLGVQQARTEDKLEELLQEVLRLEAELRRARSGKQ